MVLLTKMLVGKGPQWYTEQHLMAWCAAIVSTGMEKEMLSLCNRDFKILRVYYESSLKL